MARHATIIGQTRDVWGHLYDVREARVSACGCCVLMGWYHGARGRGYGGPRVILTAELAARLRQAGCDRGRIIAMAQELGIARSTVRRLRGALGLDYYGQAAQWWADRGEDLDRLSEIDFARKHGRSPASVAMWRARLGQARRCAKVGYHRQPRIVGLLRSTLPHAVVAPIIGKSPATVRKLRWMLRREGVDVPTQREVSHAQ